MAVNPPVPTYPPLPPVPPTTVGTAASAAVSTQKAWYDNAVAVLHWVTILGGGLTSLASYFATVPGLPPTVLQITGGGLVAVGIVSYGLHSALAYSAELNATSK